MNVLERKKLKSWSPRVLDSWSQGVPESRSPGVPKSRSPRVKESLSPGVPEFRDKIEGLIVNNLNIFQSLFFASVIFWYLKVRFFFTSDW